MISRELLIGLIVVLLIVVATVWAAGGFTSAPIVAYVTSIRYSSPGAVGGGPPYLSYTLTGSLTVTPALQKRTAILKSFTPADLSAGPIVSLLLQGLPFVPTWSTAADGTPVVSTNALSIGLPQLAAPQTIAGRGLIEFV